MERLDAVGHNARAGYYIASSVTFLFFSSAELSN